MNFNTRKQSFIKLGEFMASNHPTIKEVIQCAYQKNNWFLPEFIENALNQITTQFLTPKSLHEIAEKYPLNKVGLSNLNIGVIMAGNIPLVGFHDFLCVLLAGFNIQIKLSTKDDVLLPFLIQKLIEIEPAFKNKIEIKDRLLHCNAYITAGSNNSSRYFEFYFGKKPHIIRANKTSIAILNGQETEDNLENLTNDIFLYFGMGCRNVSCLFLPQNYNFDSLINHFKKYD
ncbi:MAG: acyl-CoA reductase, partial [Sediminibacterium sp.]|nr:acyl-CoA reductase [Sediminibacterium sp.]